MLVGTRAGLAHNILILMLDNRKNYPAGGTNGAGTYTAKLTINGNRSRRASNFPSGTPTANEYNPRRMFEPIAFARRIT